MVTVVLRAFQLPLLAWAIGAAIDGPVTHGEVRGVILAAAGYAVLAILTQLTFRYRSRLALELGENVMRDAQQQRAVDAARERDDDRIKRAQLCEQRLVFLAENHVHARILALCDRRNQRGASHHSGPKPLQQGAGNASEQLDRPPKSGTARRVRSKCDVETRAFPGEPVV
jgi:hypothetical protein